MLLHFKETGGKKKNPLKIQVSKENAVREGCEKSLLISIGRIKPLTFHSHLLLGTVLSWE